MRVRWTPLATSHLESAYEYLAAENAAAAGKTIDLILASVERLAEYPQMGRPGRVESTRELVIARTPFVVGYRLRGDQAQILAVLHGTRRWPERLE